MKKLYFIAVEPSSEEESSKLLSREVVNLKLLYKETYGLKHALKSPPHITLMSPFECDDSPPPPPASCSGIVRTPPTREQVQCALDELVQMERCLREPFKVRFDGFGLFDHQERRIRQLQEEESKADQPPAKRKLLSQQLQKTKANRRYTVFAKPDLDSVKEAGLIGEQQHPLFTLRRALVHTFDNHMWATLSQFDKVGIPLENYHPHMTIAFKDLYTQTFDKLWYGEEECGEEERRKKKEEQQYGGGVEYFLTGLKDKAFKREMLVDRISLLQYDRADGKWNCVYQTEQFGSRLRL
eukprot:Nk52_evm43s2391 gene=Nk52_evmTU43s2391